MGDTLQSIHNWLAEPFNTDQSAFRWVLFVGFIVCALFLWQMILLIVFAGVEKL